MRFACIVIFCATVAALFAADPPSGNTPAKKKAVSAAASKKGATVRKRKGKSPGPPVAASSRSRQAAPTLGRYKEIQQALASKGYLKSEPSGVWDSESTDAMKRFQTDQNLTPTGKITAPALIGLGLGPKPVGALQPPEVTPR
jgi:hypothetical protein